ncbi:hypothetical protein [Mesorhizobium sp. L2C084A000]|uniref:hypothetical protein n=1 Tax=Mesorhizobium sp. L2C084A000 TaxID=1287116 RepID=UPI0003D048A6|nr:hypothetical protein [Mesorhizobium sp. L2C084A000]ESZ24269.1 hypothetical protein X734_23630 [Mesorhizobium sp. L2C084A000]
MAELTGAGAIEIIPIHFDVPEHHLELKTFIETAAQTELIIAGLNEYLFEGRLEYQVLVLPPEIGTFKTRLAIAAATAATISWGAVESDIGAAFIKGLTGHEPVYWSELAGGYVGELLADEMKVPPSATDARIECRTGALILSESTKSFLQKDVSELNKIGIRPMQFREGMRLATNSMKHVLQILKYRELGSLMPMNFQSGAVTSGGCMWRFRRRKRISMTGHGMLQLIPSK